MSRRTILSGAGLALGTVALSSVGCGGELPGPVPNSTGGGVPDRDGHEGFLPEAEKTLQFPYRQFIPPEFRFDVAKAKEDAYHGYYAGACCHGVFAPLLDQLATLGSPFDRLPRDLMRFGGGGISSYGSICGSLLGGVMLINLVTADAAARDPMITELLRWYEKTPFPSYLPVAKDAKESGTTLDFTQPTALQVVPGSHLCHASVSGWCHARNVSSTSGDKKARCSRLTADVIEKVADLLNHHFEATPFTVTPVDSDTATCTSCHTKSSTTPPTAATGMGCTVCHGDPHPNW